MKKLFILAFLLSVTTLAFGQKFSSKFGKVNFVASTPLQNIEASNPRATIVIDYPTGRLDFSLLIKDFHFPLALMEEHFNENFMEIGKYYKAIFAGKIDNITSVDLKKDGVYNVQISGNLTMHGVTKPIITQGIITVQGDNITNGTTSFSVKYDDYKISVPMAVRDKIAKTITINVNTGNLQLLK